MRSRRATGRRFRGAASLPALGCNSGPEQFLGGGGSGLEKRQPIVWRYGRLVLTRLGLSAHSLARPCSAPSNKKARTEPVWIGSVLASQTGGRRRCRISRSAPC